MAKKWQTMLERFRNSAEGAPFAGLGVVPAEAFARWAWPEREKPEDRRKLGLGGVRKWRMSGFLEEMHRLDPGQPVSRALVFARIVTHGDMPKATFSRMWARGLNHFWGKTDRDASSRKALYAISPAYLLPDGSPNAALIDESDEDAERLRRKEARERDPQPNPGRVRRWDVGHLTKHLDGVALAPSDILKRVQGDPDEESPMSDPTFWKLLRLARSSGLVRRLSDGRYELAKAPAVVEVEL